MGSAGCLPRLQTLLWLMAGHNFLLCQLPLSHVNNLKIAGLLAVAALGASVDLSRRP